MRDLSASFNDTVTTKTGWIDTGPPQAGGRSTYTWEQDITTTAGPKKWRVRVLTDIPMFPASRWYTLTENGALEADLVVVSP